jgi:hypothetical protein
MRRFTVVFCFVAALGMAAGPARAGDIAPDWSYNTSTLPTATTNGMWWVNTGGGPTLLSFDVNAELLGGTTQSNIALLYAADNPAIFLVSDTSGFGGYGDITWNGDGLFCPGAFYGYLIPGTSTTSKETVWVEVKAWTGNYSTYQAAYAASAAGQAVYVADVTFQNPTGYAIEVPTQQLTNSPAIVLQRGLLGDANYDGKVDVNDLTIVLTNFGETGTTWSQGDFNADGKVDINDLTIVLANYGQSVGASGAGIAAVPEPGALALLAAGSVGLLAYGWRRRK